MHWRLLSLPLILFSTIGGIASPIGGPSDRASATQTAPPKTAKSETAKSETTKSETTKSGKAKPEKPKAEKTKPEGAPTDAANSTGKVTAEPSSNLPWVIGGGAAVLGTLGGAIALYQLGRQSGQEEAQVDNAVRQYRALAELEPAAPSTLEESLYGLKSASIDQSSLDEFSRDLQEFAGAQLEQTPAAATAAMDGTPLDGTEFDGIQWDMAQIDAAFADVNLPDVNLPDVNLPDGESSDGPVAIANATSIESIAEQIGEPSTTELAEPKISKTPIEVTPIEVAPIEPATAVTVVVDASPIATPITQPPSPTTTPRAASELVTSRTSELIPSPVTAEIVTPRTMRPGLAARSARLPQVGVVEGLLKEIQNPDPSKRRKAIWELGQWGDTRAVQPLVDMMLEADSKQRSLILSSLTEIGTRTLKPMSKALAISLQDDSPDVRRNAIRDLTRLYDLVSQISQMVQKTAIDDPDDAVRDTANWALKQLNRIRPPVMDENLIAIASTVSAPERLPAAD